MLTAFAVTECINNYRIEQQFQQSHKKRPKKNEVETRQLNSILWPIKLRGREEKERPRWRKGVCGVQGTVMAKH